MLSVGITDSRTQRHPNTGACRSCYGEKGKKGEKYVGYKGSEMGNAAASGTVRLCVERKEEVYVKLKKRIETKTRIKSQSRSTRYLFKDHAITKHSAFLSSHHCQIHKNPHAAFYDRLIIQSLTPKISRCWWCPPNSMPYSISPPHLLIPCHNKDVVDPGTVTKCRQSR